MADSITAKDLSDPPKRVAVEHDAECSECGDPLRPKCPRWMWKADTGTYCSVACFRAHVRFLVAVMNEARR
jgi:hypothetical protein